MASFTAGTTFVDGVANNVTAAKLGTLVTAALPTSGLIQDRTAETVVATNDTFLIGDASDSNTLKRMTVANVMKAEHTGTINTTAGTITTLNSTTGTITGLNSTTGTVATLNSTTGTIATLNSTTPTFLGAITASTNTINVGSGQIYKDASGLVGIGTASPTSKLHLGSGDIRLENGNYIVWGGLSNGITGNAALNLLSLHTNATERLRIDSSGNVGIGTDSPDDKLDVNGFAVLGTDVTTGQASTKFHKFKGTAVQSGASWFGSYGGLLLDTDSSFTANARKFLITNSLTSNKFAIIRSTTATTDPSLGDAGAITSGTADFVITNAGEIGIGTTSPSAKLDVNGSFNATSGTIATLNSTTGTITGFRSTTGTVTTLNSTTGTITNLSTTLAGDLAISQGTATVGTRVAVVNTAQEYTAAHNFNATTLTSGTSIAWDLQANQVARLVLSTNGTMADATNKVDGSTYILLVTQGTGSNTLAWNATYKWPGGTAPTLTTGSAKSDIFTFLSNGTSLFGVASQNYS